MLSKKMEKALNDQVNAELYSAYLYWAMSAYFESINLPGFANWLYVQRQEETTHAEKLYNYVNARGGRALLGKIDAPPSEWKSPMDAVENVLAHEQKVTSLINKLMDLAVAEKDHATASMLRWFVDEQVEEEENATEIVNHVTMVKDSPNGMYMLDQKLGQRVFTAEAAAEE